MSMVAKSMDDYDSDFIHKLKENGHKPVRVTRSSLRIGDEQFPYPILEESISVRPYSKTYNLLTMTFLVGPVTIDLEGNK
jgi:hypothetical protein